MGMVERSRVRRTTVIRRCAIGVAAVIVAAGCNTTSSPTIGSTTTLPEDLTTTSLRADPGGSSPNPTTTSDGATTSSTIPESLDPLRVSDVAVVGPRGFGWNDNFVVPGPVIEHEGTLYMFYVGHTYTAPNLERGQVGVATSVDGHDWAFSNTEPLFDGSDLEWTEGAVYPTSGLVMDDGTWVLWFSAAPRAFSNRALVIGRATAPGPDGPWAIDPEPVLVGGGPGTWNEKGVSHASVIRYGDGYRMYFDGHIDDLDSERDRSIGLALSDDAITWSLYDDPETDGLYAASDPVLLPGDPDAWDGSRVMAPEVVIDGDRLIMVYLTSKRRTDQPGFLQDFGYAVSEDGIHWVRSPTNPVIDNRGSIVFITSIAAARIGDELFVFYDIAGNLSSSASFIVASTAPISEL
jgi:hypothetical protein